MQGDVDLAEVPGSYVYNAPRLSRRLLSNTLRKETLDSSLSQDAEENSEGYSTVSAEQCLQSCSSADTTATFPTPAFNFSEFDFAVGNERNIRTEDKWTVQLWGKAFHFKSMELQDVADLSQENPF